MPRRQFADNCRSGVGRMVVDHQNTKPGLRIILRKQRPQARPDIRFLISRWNDHGDERRTQGRWRRRAEQAGKKPALLQGSADQPRTDREPCEG